MRFFSFLDNLMFITCFFLLLQNLDFAEVHSLVIRSACESDLFLAVLAFIFFLWNINPIVFFVFFIFVLDGGFFYIFFRAIFGSIFFICFLLRCSLFTVFAPLILKIFTIFFWPSRFPFFLFLSTPAWKNTVQMTRSLLVWVTVKTSSF